MVLCGTSVGGASVVYAAVRLQRLGASVAGVVCENPVAHPERFVEEHMAKILAKLSPGWFWPVCRLFLFLATNIFLFRIGLFWNRKTGCASAVVRDLTVPLLVMHGTADEVPRLLPLRPVSSHLLFCRLCPFRTAWKCTTMRPRACDTCGSSRAPGTGIAVLLFFILLCVGSHVPASALYDRNPAEFRKRILAFLELIKR